MPMAAGTAGSRAQAELARRSQSHEQSMTMRQSGSLNLERKPMPLKFVVKTLDFRVQSSTLMGDLFVYIPFLIMFVFFFIHGRNIGDSFFIVDSLRALLVEANVPNLPIAQTYMDIGSSGDWNLWFTTLLVPTLFDPVINNTARYAAGQNLLLGSLRVRTLRVHNASCSVNANLYPAVDELSRECYGKFSRANEFTKQYGGPTGTGFAWSDPKHVPGTRTTGDVAAYHNGGYIQLMSFDMDQSHAMAIANSTIGLGFIDDIATRFVTVEFFTYAPQFNTFASVKLFAEVAAGGSWVPNKQLRLFKVWTKKEVPQLIFDFFFLAFVLYYVFDFLRDWYRSWRRHRSVLSFICELWNFLECVNLVTFLVVFVLKWLWWTKSNGTAVRLPFSDYPGDLDKINYLFSLQVYFNSLNTVISFLKLLKFVRLNDRLNVLTRTMEECQQNIIGVLILFVFVVFGFSITGNTLFGNTLWDWRNLNTSFSTLMRMLLGDFDYPSMREENKWLAGIFFWSFEVLGLFLLLNFIIAIIAEGFTKVNTETTKVTLDSQIAHALGVIKKKFGPQNLKDRATRFCKRKSVNQLLSAMVDQLDMHLRAKTAGTNGEVAHEHNYYLQHFTVDDLPRAVKDDVLHDLGPTLLEELWQELEREWDEALKNDEETAKREQEERVRTGVALAMADSIELVRSMDARVDKLQAEISTILQLVQAQQQQSRTPPPQPQPSGLGVTPSGFGPTPSAGLPQIRSRVGPIPS